MCLYLWSVTPLIKWDLFAYFRCNPAFLGTQQDKVSNYSIILTLTFNFSGYLLFKELLLRKWATETFFFKDKIKY